MPHTTGPKIRLLYCKKSENDPKDHYILRSTNRCFPITEPAMFPPLVAEHFEATAYNVCMHEYAAPCNYHSDCRLDMNNRTSIKIMTPHAPKNEILLKRKCAPSRGFVSNLETILVFLVDVLLDLILWRLCGLPEFRLTRGARIERSRERKEGQILALQPSHKIVQHGVEFDVFTIDSTTNREFMHSPQFKNGSVVYTFYRSKTLASSVRPLKLNPEGFCEWKRHENVNPDFEWPDEARYVTPNKIDCMEIVWPQRSTGTNSVDPEGFYFSILPDTEPLNGALKRCKKWPVVTAKSLKSEPPSGRNGVYISRTDETQDRFHVLRCSSVVPTFADDTIMNFATRVLNPLAMQLFCSASTARVPNFNHCFVQEYLVDEDKEGKVGSISPHSDKTMDMPLGYYLAFYTTYEEGDISAVGPEGLSMLVFKHKMDAGRTVAFVCANSSLLVVDSSWNRNWVHSTAPINPFRARTRISAVFRESVSQRFVKDGKVYIDTLQTDAKNKTSQFVFSSRLELCKPGDGVFENIQTLYREQNKYTTEPDYTPFLSYTENPFDLQHW